MKELLDKGADMEINGMKSETALNWAAREGNIEIVRELLSRGANVNYQVAHTDMTALKEAQKNGHSEITTLLMAAGTETDSLSVKIFDAKHFMDAKSYQVKSEK